jgi:hypothetical protein
VLKVPFQVGESFEVATVGRFRVAANSEGTYFAPDDAIKMVRLPSEVTHETRKKIDRDSRRR